MQHLKEDCAQVRAGLEEKVATLEILLQEASTQATKTETESARNTERFENVISQLLTEKAGMLLASESMEADAKRWQQRIRDLEISVEEERARYGYLKDASETAAAHWSDLVKVHSEVSCTVTMHAWLACQLGPSVYLHTIDCVSRGNL